METGNYCAYNVTRNALLSDRVTVAEAALGSLQILGLVMHGPGAHQESAVWLRGFSRPPDLPRLAIFDILYLDESNRVIICGSVGPDTDYPQFHGRPTSALILADRRLSVTATGPGDQLRICSQEELAAVVKAASRPVGERFKALESDHPGAAVARFEVIRTPTYFFEPFVGTLMYMPEFPEPRPLSTEVFLPQSQSSDLSDAVDEVPESAGADASSSAQPQIPPGLIPIEEPSKTPARKHFRKSAANAKEPPTFAHPEPIRFFDPGATASDPVDVRDSSVLLEAPAPRPGSQLPPELKSAILHLDELHRQKQSANQEPAAKKKPGKAKLQREQAIEPVSTGPAQSPAAAELPSGPNLVEPPAISSPVDLQAESPVPSDAVEPLPPIGIPNQHPQPVPEPEPLEPLSAFAKPGNEIEPIEASLSSATVAKPEIPTTTILPVFGKPESAPSAVVPPPVQSAHAELIPEQPASPDTKKAPTREKSPKPKLPLSARILRWLDANPLDGKRRGERVHQPGLVAFYWSGGAPCPHEIANISKSGFYLRTRELWSLNTLVRMTLQRPSAITRDLESISVLARVVRVDEEGVGHEFVTTEDLMALRSREVLPESGTDRAQLDSFLNLQ